MCHLERRVPTKESRNRLTRGTSEKTCPKKGPSHHHPGTEVADPQEREIHPAHQKAPPQKEPIPKSKVSTDKLVIEGTAITNSLILRGKGIRGESQRVVAAVVAEVAGDIKIIIREDEQ